MIRSCWDSSPVWNRFPSEVNTVETTTVLLTRASAGDLSAKERLFQVIYDELHAIADAQLRGERPGHSFQATILVDEAFLRLVEQPANIEWRDRQHFFRVAARTMRRLLIDHERHRRARRRGGGRNYRVEVDPDTLGEEIPQLDLLALDEALDKLAVLDTRQSSIVELHHFGGRSLKETAELL
ncbi:MAG: hypothetical protein KDA60_08605, partial [Planctomycetales bacterium]|nr:hypothetical protein [Planctomycetales bacterium]